MHTMEHLLRWMAEKNASDLYLSAFTPASMRINGLVVPVNNQALQADSVKALLGEILSTERLEELEKTQELNVAHAIEGVGNFRISAMRQRGSYAAVIRYIAKDIPSLQSLHLPQSLAGLVLEKRGLILIAGATGTGKSTTLAAMINHRNTHMSGHILTVEDPIEFVFTHKKSIVNQREVGSDTQAMQTALKNALRQAPDVILIGEIRDRETMSAAIAYAQSGHLCLATLHANNSYHALNRILSFYPVEVRPTMLNDLASALKVIVSQRLLRTKVGTRIPAIEIMHNSKLVQDLIEKGDFFGVKEAMENSITEGSQTFEQDIARLIVAGLVERKEGISHSDSPTNLMWRLANNFGQTKPVQEDIKKADEGPSFTEITLDVKNSP
jgi:twitching motility protein PilU